MRWERAAILLAAVLFLWALGGHDLWAPDEPFFAEGAREMIADGQWAVPHINGEMNNHKPAFFFWLIALVSLPFGEITSWTARLPSALAALGTVLLVLRLGRRYAGPRTAATAAAVAATTFLFWDKARSAQIDATLCFFIWLALAAFVEWRAGDADGRRAGVLLWAATAFAVLAKGPVGLLLVVGIVLATLAWDRRLSRLEDLAPLLGPAVFVVIVGAWMAVATLGSHGEYSVWGALEEHVIQRGIHGMHHRQPFWYYAENLPALLLPWTGLAVGAVALAWRRRRSALDRFLLVAAFFVVLFFSISTEKRGLYVLPAMPAFALMTARFIASVQGWSEKDADERISPAWARIGQGVVGGLLALVGVALPFASERVEEVPLWIAAVLGVVLAATGITVLAMVARRRTGRSVVALAAGMTVAYLAASSLLYPALEPRKSARPFALEVREATAASRAAGHRVVAYDLGNLPTAIAFYSDGVYTVETSDPEVLERHLMQDAEVYAVVDADVLDELDPAAADRVAVLRETHLARRDVLLVSNRGAGGGGGG
jgi:4-amino-4-deoxy-L-arabinose transferase-like glycosyltransferase